MLNDNAKKWVAALRSGKYKQGQHHLNYNDESFCCLGVACELAIEAGIPLTRGTKKFTFPLERVVITYDDTGCVAPGRVAEWLGLNWVNGTFNGDGLASMNDRGMTFAQIADVIESEPKGLFEG